MPVGVPLGAIGSSLIGSSAASNASKQQVAAEQQAIAAQQAIFAQSQANLQPYNTTGQSALNTIAGLYGLSSGSSVPGSTASTGATGAGTQNFSAFTNSPDYAFAQQQGNQAVNATAAANGQLMSGGQVAAAQTFGQGLASQQFSNYFNRLMSLSGLGESAASSVSQIGQSNANAISGILGQQGASQAAGTIGSANALSGGLSALTGYGMLGKTGSSYGGASGTSGGSVLSGFNPSSFGNTFSGGLLNSVFGGS